MRRVQIALLAMGGILAALLLAEIWLRLGSPARFPLAVPWGADDRIELHANHASREAYGTTMVARGLDRNSTRRRCGTTAS
jgi:hypothetical protein